MKQRYFLQFLILVSFLMSSSLLWAQDCSRVIASNKTIDGTQILKTNQVTLVVRGTYSYGIELINDEKGITARMFSKGGVSFNQNDEIIFMDGNKNRKSYRFIEANKSKKQGETPVNENLLQLDLAAVKWFAASKIPLFYIKNNISNQMRKMTIESKLPQRKQNMHRKY